MAVETRSPHMNGLKHSLGQHYGSETLYRHWFIHKFVYSEGAKDYMIKAGAMWLGDILATEFVKPIMKLAPDVHYLKLTVKDSKCDIVLKDYKDNTLKDRHVSFTDHVEGEIDFILGWDGHRVTWCLTSEN